MHVKIAWVVFSLSLFCILRGIPAAQSPTTVWAGVYSDVQAQRGGTEYRNRCASCHGDDLAGRDRAPGLSGDDFISSWSGQTVDDLFEVVQASMPADHPGSLTRGQNADIIAFLLKSNQFPAGSSDLPSDAVTLKQIKLEAKK